VTYDGLDVRDISLAALRRHIAYVPQEPFIFAGTVRDNLLFGCREFGDRRLRQIIEWAGLTETLAAFPHGLDTVVGEKGILLSGGQKQRIALARGLMTEAPVFLLDDPISQVDAATGARIIDAISGLAGKKTIIIVSHRLAAVRQADWIISLDRGRVVEAGTHGQLLLNDGYYSRVVALQELEYAV
jgi:ATP-binding cassette subfamily B protein